MWFEKVWMHLVKGSDGNRWFGSHTKSTIGELKKKSRKISYWAWSGRCLLFTLWNFFSVFPKKDSTWSLTDYIFRCIIYLFELFFTLLQLLVFTAMQYQSMGRSSAWILKTESNGSIQVLFSARSLYIHYLSQLLH